LRRPSGALRLGQREPRLAEKGASGVGELDAPLVAREEGGAELALEIADLPAERRLGDVQSRGRVTEVQLLGDGDEVAEVAQLHGLRPAGYEC
jgi:hypothetical protein